MPKAPDSSSKEPASVKDEMRKRRNDDREKKLLEELAKIKDSDDKAAHERI